MSKQRTNTKAKKIGFFSTVLLVIGSTLGAGIFFKNKEVLNNNHGSLILSCVSWGISIIGVLAMGLTLAELAFGSKQNNKEGIIGWVKTFNSNYLYKAARCFMTWIYSPLSFFFLPYYVLLSIQDGVYLACGYQIPSYVIIGCAFLIMIWLALSAGFSIKIAHIQNWVITLIKFFPVVIVIVLGFVIFGQKGQQISNMPDPSWNVNQLSDHPLFTDLYPIFGVIASIPAIFFAFDGFYTVSSNTSEMKKPKQASMAMALGLAILSAIDVIITIAMLLGTKDGSVYNMTDWLATHGSWRWLGVAIDIMIGIGVMGILNGFALFDSFYYGALIKIGELPFSSGLKKYRINVGGTIYKTICATIAFIVFTTIGYFYLKGGYEASGDEFDSHSQRLYCFVDTMANWTALLSFGCITIAIIGGLRNRRTNKVKVEKSKLFVPCGIISVFLVGLGALYIVIEQVANVVLSVQYYIKNHVGITEQLIPTIISLAVLILFMCIMLIYPIFEIRHQKHKKGTIADMTVM